TVYTTALLFFSEEESVVEMIGKYFSQLTSPGTRSPSARRGSVESCDETENSPCLEHEERLLQQHVTRQIELCLTEAKASTLHCQVLLLPRQMTTRVGQDVVRSSADEPCGLQGACIKVYVEHKDGLKSLGRIFPDRSVTPTFELSVIFKADKEDGWPALMQIFDTSKVLKLRPEYRLVKRKLYSSASPIIHDFS
uniref:DNA damage inducible transcript 4 like n=1 Tax=Sparus aurata TaxID=8175 RepID=A0A671VME7_SPAAU